MNAWWTPTTFALAGALASLLRLRGRSVIGVPLPRFLTPSNGCSAHSMRSAGRGRICGAFLRGSRTSRFAGGWRENSSLLWSATRLLVRCPWESKGDMSLLPIFVKLRDRLVVVVGGGTVAEGKIEGLFAAEARVRIVAPEVTARINE